MYVSNAFHNSFKLLNVKCLFCIFIQLFCLLAVPQRVGHLGRLTFNRPSKVIIPKLHPLNSACIGACNKGSPMQPYMTLHLLEDPYYNQLTSLTFMGHKVREL